MSVQSVGFIRYISTGRHPGYHLYCGGLVASCDAPHLPELLTLAREYHITLRGKYAPTA